MNIEHLLIFKYILYIGISCNYVFDLREPLLKWELKLAYEVLKDVGIFLIIYLVFKTASKSIKDGHAYR